MSWTVIIRPRAEADLQEAKEWFEERRKGLGTSRVVAIRVAVAALRENPNRFPDYYRGFRRVLVRRFPYKVFYRIEGDRVIVFRVLHAKQDHTRHLE